MIAVEPRRPVSGFQSPFARLTQLLSAVPAGRSAINMTVGEPSHPVPAFVGTEMARHIADFGRYPAIRGTDAFRSAVADWSERRFGLDALSIDRADGVLPLNGSRDGLFTAAVEAVRRKQVHGRPVILMPNPFYQVYAAAAEVAGAEVVMLDAGPETGFLPNLAQLRPDILARTVAIYYASPANPQGAVAKASQWADVITLARGYGFMVFADECYSEIYRRSAPVGALKVAQDLGFGFDKVVAFNSLSKRSNVPGLRCGFAVGDPSFLRGWATSRNVYGPQVPMPVQAVAEAALADESHVVANRALYNAKYQAAQSQLGPIFGDVTPEGGFFLWLDVARFGGGEAVAKGLWQEAGVRIVPGGYLAIGDPARNPGAGFIRVAMVASLDATLEAMDRMAQYFGKG